MSATIRFNKTILSNFVREGEPVTIKDREVVGLKFNVRKKRSSFVFEKRVSGSKGSPVKITIGAFPAVSIDEARQLARYYANQCERGIDPREELKNRKASDFQIDIRLKTVVIRFFELKTDLSPRTLRSYRYQVKYHFPKSWQDLDITQITPEMLVEQFFEVRKTARDGCFKFLSLFSNVWNTCSPFFKGVNGEWLLQKNPVPYAQLMLKHVKPDEQQRQFIPLCHLGRFFVTVERWAEGRIAKVPNTIMTRRYCTLVFLCLFTGMRGLEARCLRWEYVDLAQGLIHLPGEVKGATKYFRGTKNKQDHLIPLSSFVWDLLRKIHGERTTLSPYVFPGIHSVHKPFSSHGTGAKLLREISGLDFGLHACRRTFASIADDVGVDFLKLKRSLNHAFKGGVTGGYINPGFNPERRREIFQKVCDYILRCKAEHLGEICRSQGGYSKEDALAELERFALQLGLYPEEALRLLAERSVRGSGAAS
ncbi:integrase arm-type DNA-binding domain-containing protein [Acanthopleuribacter pedis]|uniref:Integrase arm-type DNA-binding domain-containing protein n=1 Tax=Acanthopleuribacter pedis TaxID=442870 RepID=A0A8J7QLA8_9BACT|nr:integrase arm-type DNA-binding domain-containing protein [Acanthopleuribacter pedis]MBO1321980.1 integrase arm-type DNA-binding domain-containing protein [Acanthopleuribacter pedis]